MSNFGFNDMNDEEFREEFMRFLNMYQKGLENFMKKTYNVGGFGFIPKNLSNNQSIDDDRLRDIFKNLDNMGTESGEDENGSWEKRSWSSPDGKSSFSSYSRSSFYNPFDGNVKFKDESEETNTIKLLENKLNKVIMEEDYESAIKIRDLIKSLKEETKND